MSEPAQTSTETPSPKVVGRPFPKGTSGNPSGRPKGLASATRDVLARAVANGEDPALVLARFWASVLADRSAKMEHRLQAADRLADRGWGKPAQYAPIEDADPLDFSERGVLELAAEFDDRLDELAEKRRAKHAA